MAAALESVTLLDHPSPRESVCVALLKSEKLCDITGQPARQRGTVEEAVAQTVVSPPSAAPPSAPPIRRPVPSSPFLFVLL